MTDFNLITDALAALYDDDANSAAVYLQQFIVLNTPADRYGFKIYDWISKDAVRPNYCGVYHDEEVQMAVATDTRVLVASKNDYRQECAGKIIKRDGDEQRGRFPDWNRVFPQSLEEYHHVTVDRERIKELLKQAKVERRVDSSARYKAIRIKQGIYLAPESCKLMLTLPDGKFFVKDSNTPIAYFAVDGKYMALLFPIRIDESLWEQELIPE